jgi:hypothetical protein
MKTQLFGIAMIMVMALPFASAFDGNALASDIDIRDGEAKLKEMIPATLEDAEANIAPIKNRYLLWTRDGRHIMWGTYGRGYLTGKDNLGKHAWGIYGSTVFAGFYDGRFFYGWYRGGQWKAHGLFHLRSAYGNYVLFPGLQPVAVQAETLSN